MGLTVDSVGRSRTVTYKCHDKAHLLLLVLESHQLILFLLSCQVCQFPRLPKNNILAYRFSGFLAPVIFSV